MQPAIKMALRVARQGSDYLKAHFERHEFLGREADDQTQQLDRIEQSIYTNFSEQLEKTYKDHSIAPLNEVDAAGAEKSWHIFPLIGREAFQRGIPECALVLIQKKDNRTENVLLVNPITGEEYAASRGHGASLNSRRIRVNPTAQLAGSAVAANTLTRGLRSSDPQALSDMTLALAQSGSYMRISECPLLDLARVAAGRLDLALIWKPEPVELAVGQLLAQEAGALSADFAGNPTQRGAKQLVVASPKLFKETLRLIHPYQSRLAAAAAG